MNKNSIQSVIAGEESSKAAATNPSLTQTMIRIILDATIRSSTVDYSCGTVRSRITTYSRINDYELKTSCLYSDSRSHKPREDTSAGRPRHAWRMPDKNRANATKTDPPNNQLTIGKGVVSSKTLTYRCKSFCYYRRRMYVLRYYISINK